MDRYKSKMKSKEKYINKDAHKTMGYAETPLNPPEKYLHQGKGMTQPIKTADHTHVKLGNMPHVPKKSEMKVKQERPLPNFRVMNIKKIIKTKAKEPEPKCADTRHGDVQKLKNSGLVLQYTMKKAYGELPKYVCNRNKEFMQAEEEYRKRLSEKKSMYHAVTQDEREQLLENLKKSWKEKTTAFIQLPVVIDTIPKRIQKGKIEKELIQLEKDIRLIEENPHIYVYK